MFPFWEHALYPTKHKNGLKQLLSFINGYFAATEKNITLCFTGYMCGKERDYPNMEKSATHQEDRMEFVVFVKFSGTV